MASALLVAADDHLRDLGMVVAEAYPRAVPPREGMGWTSSFYKGSRSMFEQAGYQHVADVDFFHVMRKPVC